MKTTTILNAFEIVNHFLRVNDPYPTNPQPDTYYESRRRQRDTFRSALLARIEQGDKAREALKLAAEAYRANEGGVLDVILRWYQP